MCQFKLTINGSRASGKSTIMRLIKIALEKEGYTVDYDITKQQAGEVEFATIKSSYVSSYREPVASKGE